MEATHKLLLKELQKAIDKAGYYESKAKNLELILEHSLEYYTNPREFHFVEGGFVNYSISEHEDYGTVLYVANIYVAKDYRGSKAFKELLDFCKGLEYSHNIETAFAKTALTNEHYVTMHAMYMSIGFTVVENVDGVSYYRLDV